MNTHTPGPWHWEADAVKDDPMGRVRYQVVAIGKTITKIYYSSYEGGLTNADADARLIAAAPELLSALRDVVDWLDDGNRILSDSCAADVAKARAAISKATGAATVEPA